LVTVTVVVSDDDNSPSLAASCSPYVPTALNEAVVLAAEAFVKFTVPGPDTFDHVVVNDGCGNPSSDTVPANVASDGMLTDTSGPALTTGALLDGGWP
jgi:hypothetical protein